MDAQNAKRAFISVADAKGVAEFAKALADEFGMRIAAVGQASDLIGKAGVAHDPFDASAYRPQAGDVVIVNLPVFDGACEGDSTSSMSGIDVAGPAMLRIAAKACDGVTVVTDPSIYNDVLAEMRAHGGDTTPDTRMMLALEAFRATSAYDTAVATWLARRVCGSSKYPDKMNVQLTKRQDLRYGENPHQSAAFYRRSTATDHSIANASQLNGKPLSYNNIIDVDACWAIVREFEKPGVVILKHQVPCGSALGDTVAAAFARALACDEKSAVGGVVAANRTVTADMVRHMAERNLFVEVLIAPGYDPEALDLLKEKPNLRVLATGGIDMPGAEPEYRTVDGGLLVQDVDAVVEDPAAFTVPTKRTPTDAEMRDLLFAWKVVKGAKSNAILVAKDCAGIGLGAGQANRVDSCEIACKRAGDGCKGAVVASDAFFPFRDNIDVLAAHGITAIIQPGGSIRDAECIQACDEAGIAMVFTGNRHFRH